MTIVESDTESPRDPGRFRAADGALVIGGDYRALGVVRSLGRHGIRSWVLTGEHYVAAVSRYSSRRLPWPAGTDSARFAYLLRLCEQHGLQGWSLFPTDDETAAFLSHYHAALGKHFRLTTPPWDVLRWGYDKRLVHCMAGQLGLDQPWTRTLSNRQEAAQLDCPFPAVLKPAYKRSMNSFTQAKAWRVDNRASLVSSYDEACELVDADSIIVQEMISGGGEQQFSYGALCVDGQPVVSITARRTRQYPTDFGHASSYVESVENPEVEIAARRFLDAARVTGLAEVEFKRDPRDGRYKLLDVNLRVWGWHTLGRLHGADFPYLLWQFVHGQELPQMRVRAGLRWLRMSTDLPVVLGEILRGRLSLRDYLGSFRRPLQFAISAFDDPLPALIDAPVLVWLACRRGIVRLFARRCNLKREPSLKGTVREGPLFSEEFEIRPIRPNEVHAAAALHYEFLGEPDVARWSFLKLGSRFLEAVFYRLNLDNPYFFALGAFWRGRLIGLQVFTTDRRKMFRHLLKKHGAELALHILEVLIRHPLTLCRYLLANFHPFRHDVLPPMRRIPAALLLMLVLPEARAKSFVARTHIWVGGGLLEAMEAVMRANGCWEYWAETAEDNSLVHNLARRVGAKCIGETLRQGALMRFIVAPVREPSAKRVKGKPTRQTAA